MSNRWPGGLIRKTPVTPNGPNQFGAASGVWTLAEASYWTKQGLWPIAGFIVDGTFAIFSLGQQFGGGAGTPVTNRYTYAGNVVVAGGNLTANNYSGGGAAGNTTVGIFALGFSPSTTGSAARNKYTYASNTAASATAAGSTSIYGSAAGNSTAGVFALGVNAGGTRLTTREYILTPIVSLLAQAELQRHRARVPLLVTAPLVFFSWAAPVAK
jgi:hypothetical protein